MAAFLIFYIESGFLIPSVSLRSTPPLTIRGGKVCVDKPKFKALVASETRSLRILRRERTQKYVTEQKRKDDTVFRDTSRLNFRQVRYIEV